MTKELKLFTGVVVVGTAAYSALGDTISHLPSAVGGIADFLMVVLFFWIVFNFIYRLIYRLVGVTNKLMFKGWSQGWPRPTHQQTAEINKYWLVWLGGSLSTYMIYTLIFHRLQWKGALIFCAAIIAIVSLARLNSQQKIAGHTKKELFK